MENKDQEKDSVFLNKTTKRTFQREIEYID